MTHRDDDAIRGAGYRVLGLDELARLKDERRELANDILVGLSERPKRIPSRYFYDDEGSRLFQRIMALDEYYLTEVEREILERDKARIVGAVGARPVDVVDLGAGDGAKTMILLGELVRRGIDFRYVPIDVSEGAMREVVANVRARFGAIEVAGIIASYVDGLEWLAASRSGRATFVLFLGSNIGNFDRAHARAFLQCLWSALRVGDHLLVGFDLKKDIDVLLAAYNDPDGVTAAFNLNLLTRINRELGGTFDIEKFRHFGTYDVFSGAMKSYLVSLEPQSIWIGALRHAFYFDAWEPVHTEYSYKYLPRDIASLARDTGFSIDLELSDARGYFLDSLWRVDHANEVR